LDKHILHHNKYPLEGGEAYVEMLNYYSKMVFIYLIQELIVISFKMPRGRQSKQSKRTSNKMGNQSKMTVIACDLTPAKIDKLPETIKFAMATRSAILPFSSMGDHLPGVELCQMPEVKELFIKACIDYGLLGWLLHQQSYFPDSHESITTVSMITCGSLHDSDDKKCIIKMDNIALEKLFMTSINKAQELYGV
jgi:hypothetical protein